MAPHAIYVEMQTYAIKLFQSNKKKPSREEETEFLYCQAVRFRRDDKQS